MRALDLVELKAAAEGLERMIAVKKRQIRDNYLNVSEEPVDLIDRYMMQYMTGELILAPMLAAQITIVNQIKAIEDHELMLRKNQELIQAHMLTVNDARP